MTRLKRRRPRPEDFTIAWICALPLEYAAAKQSLDDLYEELDEYTTGRIHTMKWSSSAYRPAASEQMLLRPPLPG
jgi:hypothetical protein